MSATALLMMLGMQAPDAAVTVTYLGSCSYPEAARQYQAGTDFVSCHTFMIERGDQTTRFAFGRKSRGEEVVCYGKLSARIL